MSKRSGRQSNTLLNYFQSPKDKPKIRDLNASTSGSNSNLDESVERMDTGKESDEEVVKFKSKKRGCIALIDSESDIENNESSPEFRSRKSLVTKRAKLSSNDSFDENNEEVMRSGNKEGKDSRKVPLKSYTFEKSASDTDKQSVKEKIDSSKSRSVSSQSSEKANTDGGNWVHNKLDFLKPERIRDINKNRSDSPDYDSKTLYVPEDFLNKQTPAMRQWWILKSKHFDSVLFFKLGKFYELYHMDAVIGVNNLGLSYMKGEFAHSGFPESAYGKMASSLVEQGFKVARVEQTETPEMMAERCKSMKKPGKFDKVVSREICQITTTATCMYGAQLTEPKQALPCYMLSIAEKQLLNGSKFGVCFIDTSIGIFHLGEFSDDKYCSRLLALLAQHPTGLVLTERGHMQSSTTELLKKTLGNVRRDTLAPNTQFQSAQNTLDLLAKGCYFRNKDDNFEWPPILKDLIEDGSPKPGYELACKALGACVWYLKDSELDIHMLSMKKFEIYQPVDMVVDKKTTNREYMILDSTAMENLSLLGTTGTLQKTLDYCETAFGKRLLQQWICRPLCIQHRILERQKAVEELYFNDEMRISARAVLKKLPDLERQVAKIHTFGNRFCAQYHPDSRAIFYEAKTYSKRKIKDLINTMQGFEKSQELVQIFAECESKLLKKLTHYPPEKKYLDLSKTLQFFRDAFDQKQAETDGKIIPQKGVDDEYDQVDQEIADILQESKDFLEEQEKFFGCKLAYFGTDKKRFQIEVPEHRTTRVTTDFLLEGTKKGSKPAKRYSTPVTRKFLTDIMKAEAKKNRILQDLNRRIFEKFSDRHDEWEQAIQCIMMLDVLCSFAEYAKTSPHHICFPVILPFSDESYIDIENGVHPCTLLDDFVPNNTTLGTNNLPKIMLLTGPNMGGKSTLMRQVALITIMAQMGCPVPATSCKISLVDRIFTRLGAHDDILQGQSTFLVELSEASAILQHATCNSFVLLDELGRGTSTHDGNAIATAYVKKLTEIDCRTIFSTHYHTLVDYFSGRNDIQLAHMACMTDDDDEHKDDPLLSVTLLYKLREGKCPKSYGFNAATLAGLPKTIINRAHEVAVDLENLTKVRKLLRSLLLEDKAAHARKIIESLH